MSGANLAATGRFGKQVMLDVKLQNGVRLYFGDLGLLFERPEAG